MTVELISVGTEILMGNIVNTNAAWLAKECAALGLSCFYQSVVGDNEDRLKEQMKTSLERSDIVILTGGLGQSTTDDLTKETAALLMGKKLVTDQHSLERVKAYFQVRGIEMTENNKKQALVPEGARVLDNDNGTAPGLILESGEKCMILLPGPPNEMKPLFEAQVKPFLKALNPCILYSRTVKLCGIGESKAAAMVQDMIDTQENPTIAPYAKTGEVHFRVTAQAQNEKEGKKLVKPVVKQLKHRFGQAVFATKEEETLEKALADLLLEKGLMISFAESCTGGMIAGRLVNVPGVSKAFGTGYVTYSNKAKRKLLGVKKSTLKQFGAVSVQTAKEMARGALLASGAEVAVSVTGIAGQRTEVRTKSRWGLYISAAVFRDVPLCRSTIFWETVKKYGNRQWRRR